MRAPSPPLRFIPSNVLAAAVAALFSGTPLAAPATAPSAPVAGAFNRVPAFLGPVTSKHYDGVTDDLLTGGLGKTGLAGAAPAFADPLAPTAAELRRNAIHTNYRAVLDILPAGGYGTLYGPNVDAEGNVTADEGLIAGTEHLAYADDSRGRKNVTLMVQVPDSFDTARPCIVTAPSSGSRGIYGAIGASAEWGLKRGCAVAYTDKGTGNGLHDLQADTVGLIDGIRSSADAAGSASHFTAALSDAERTAFNAATPNRAAFKHAHSQQNPESEWGRNVLQSLTFAFYVLNEQFSETDARGRKRVVIDPRNTLVIASGISNGAGASLLATEQDKHGLIDAVAVTEPQIQPGDNPHLVIRQGDEAVPVHGRPLADYFTVATLYQPCAALAVGTDAPLFALLDVGVLGSPANRCAGLAARGLVSGTTMAEQAADALAKLHAYGWLPDSDLLQASHYRFATPAIAMTYTNTYGAFSVADNLCGFSFAATDATGAPAPLPAATAAAIFATGNGIPPTAGINIVYNDAAGGPRLDLIAVSPSTGVPDYAFDGALCQRALVTGRDPATGERLRGVERLQARRLQSGIEDVLAEGRLRGKPALIVHGRNDTLVPVNHSSRAYVGKALMRDGQRSPLSYIEVTNAQHFDAFLGFPGYDSRYLPLHVYLIRALDAMWDHLTEGTPLPPSQVVRTTPRGGAPGAAPAITAANVPEFAAEPAESDRIIFDRPTLQLPD